MSARDGEPSFELTLGGVFVPLLRRGRVVVLLAILGLAGGVAHYLLAPPQFICRFSVLPESESGLGSLGALAELGGMAGIQLPMGDDQSILYPDVIRSDRILLQLLQDVESAYGGQSLREFLGFAESSDATGRALEELRERITARRDTKTGLLTVGVHTADAAASQRVGERILELLDRYYRESSAGKAGRLRAFLDERLGEVRSRLAETEGRLTTFRLKNRANLDSPTLRLEEARLQREVLIQETLFVELTKQVELASVSEKKNLPVIRVLDQPRQPQRQASPRPVRSVALGGMLGGVVGVLIVYLGAYVLPVLRDLRRRAQLLPARG